MTKERPLLEDVEASLNLLQRDKDNIDMWEKSRFLLEMDRHLTQPVEDPRREQILLTLRRPMYQPIQPFISAETGLQINDKAHSTPI